MVRPPGPDEARGRRSLARWLTVEELAGALRHHARGHDGAEASIELIVRHGYWLAHDVFRDVVDARPSLDDADELMACVDWERLEASPPPGPAAAQTVLWVAAALAGHPTARPVTLSALDADTLGLVIGAALHTAAGPRLLSAVICPFMAATTR